MPASDIPLKAARRMHLSRLLTVATVILSFSVLSHAQIPTITSVTPTDTPTRGGDVITINGSGFSRSGAVTFDATAVEVSEWSPTRVLAITPAGDPGPVELVVSDENGVASASFDYAYQLPSIAQVAPQSVPSTGGTVLTISGTNFGRSSASRTWTVDGVTAGSEQWLGHERVTVVMPPLPSGGQKIVRGVVAGFASNDFPIEVLGEAPVIAQISPVSGPTQGGTTITIEGENFGAQPGNVTVCSTPSEVTSWTDTRVVCVTPACFSGLQPIVLSTATGPQIESPVSFGYEPPVIESVEPAEIPARGGITITVTGRNFGVQSAPRVVTFDDTPAEEIEWRGHDQIVVSSPPVLPGAPVNVCARVGTEVFCAEVSSAPVQLASIEPTSGPRGGGVRLTIRGQNFGVDPTTPRNVRLGSLPASDVALVDDATLLATTPPSETSGSVEVLVEVAGAVGSLPGGFTYETVTSVEGPPTDFALHANEPNPFSARTAIAMDLPRATPYRLTVFDVRGRLVREVVDRAGPGRVILRWDGSDRSGTPMASGIYFYRLESEGFSQTRRMVLLR